MLSHLPDLDQGVADRVALGVEDAAGQVGDLADGRGDRVVDDRAGRCRCRAAACPGRTAPRSAGRPDQLLGEGAAGRKARRRRAPACRGGLRGRVGLRRRRRRHQSAGHESLLPGARSAVDPPTWCASDACDRRRRHRRDDPRRRHHRDGRRHRPGGRRHRRREGPRRASAEPTAARGMTAATRRPGSAARPAAPVPPGRPAAARAPSGAPARPGSCASVRPPGNCGAARQRRGPASVRRRAPSSAEPLAVAARPRQRGGSVRPRDALLAAPAATPS